MTHLTWLFLTKRVDNLAKDLPSDWGDGYRNVWLGATIENRRELARRLSILKSTPAAVRYISFEPLLESIGDIDLTGIHWAFCAGVGTRNQAGLPRFRDHALYEAAWSAAYSQGSAIPNPAASPRWKEGYTRYLQGEYAQRPEDSALAEVRQPNTKTTRRLGTAR
jgi:hypothetical protein